MIGNEPEPHAHDARYLTPLQWTVMKRSIIRGIHVERGRMLRSVAMATVAALRRGWRSLRERQRRVTNYAP